MLKIEAPLVELVQLNEEHLNVLFNWRCDSDFLKYCTNRKKKVTLEEFRKELQRDFSFDRHKQFIIFKKSDNKAVGTIYSYNFNNIDGHVFVTTYLEPNSRSSLYSLESFTSFVLWLFKEYENLHKIYVDVYEYNQSSLVYLKKAGFLEEGRFREHRLYNEKRWDMFRLAFYRSEIEEFRHFTRRIKPI